MNFVESIKKGFRILVNPGKETSSKFGIKDALKFYYSFAVIGFILAVVVALLLYASGAGFGGFISNFSHGSTQKLSTIIPSTPASTVVAIGLMALMLFVVVPAGLFVDSALYQLIGKLLFKMWKGAYYKTFVAQAFAAVPALLLYWSMMLPSMAAYISLSLIAGIYSLIIFIIGLASQHKVSRVKSLEGVLLTIVIATVVAMVIAIIAVLAVIFV